MDGNYDWSSQIFKSNAFASLNESVTDPCNIEGSAGAKDNYPLTGEPIIPFIHEFSEIIIPIVGLMSIALVFSKTRKKKG